MKFNKWLLSGVVLGAALLFWWWQWERRIVHYHAGFIVYANGVKQDFTDPKYMKMEKCGEEDMVDEQMEKAHLHDGVGDVAHIHRRGAKWGDLFRNLKYELPKGELVGYVNGQRINQILNYPIRPYDNLILVLGKRSQVDLGAVISLERIKEVEKMSENCGH